MRVAQSSIATIIFASASVAAPAAEAAQEQKVTFDIPAGPLDKALVRFARQARVSIDINDPALRRAKARRLKGRYSVRQGLQRLLRGTGYSFSVSSDRVVRLTRARRNAGTSSRKPKPSPAPASRNPPPQRKPPAPAPPPPPLPPPEPIIVTASKQNTKLADYAGAIQVASFDLTDSLRFGGRGSELLMRELPNLSSTNLGSGRNKIFIRGVADSSFNGQTQSTISQYLGESRLTYSAPDPDLALYDLESVEIIEGPQGTLYGAGSLGGVIRTTMRRPELGSSEMAGVAGASFTSARLGGEVAVMGNAPINDRAAARVVAYGITRPGYIDDLERQQSDVNSTNVLGIRATLSTLVADDFTIDAGVVGQNTRSKDGQYVDVPGNALARRSKIAQPFSNDYRLAFVTGRGSLGDLTLVTNTAYVHHAIDTTFDATTMADSESVKFEDDVKVSMLSHETRFSGSFGAVPSWVAGFSAVHNRNMVDRALGTGQEPADFTSVRSDIFDGAIFGEATIDLKASLALTAGARLSYIHQVAEFGAPFDIVDLEPERGTIRFLPTAALSWKPSQATIAYVRYQEGFRPGAVQLVGTGTNASVSRFEPDELRTVEAGVRFGTNSGAKLSGAATFSYTKWNDVQADLVSPDGFPFVANLGSGFVRYTALELTWKPTDQVMLEASGFMATSTLNKPAPAFVNSDERELPNIADGGWRLTAVYEPIVGALPIRINASAGYTGVSYLAIGDPFEFEQGDFIEASVGARMDFGNWGIAIDVDNVFDSRANRFSFGNPFSLAAGNQRTPLRPRTIRLGIDAHF